ncbi:MAG: PIN domain-containing protein [Gemmatimonadales bacterium]
MARPGRSRQHRRVREKAPPGYPTDPARGIVGVLYDSDVIIEILRGRKKVVAAARALETSGVPTYCTAISWAEVYAGIRPGEEPFAQSFFESRGELLLDGRAGRRAGSYLARYRRSHGLELADALLAAAAVTSGVRLWTLNRKHYPMPDLEFYDG